MTIAETGPRLPRPMVGVVADDITGSGDIGVMFAKHGYAVRIFGAETDLATLPQRLAGRRTDVVIIDTDSRMYPPRAAYAKVRQATEVLRQVGCQLFWKKTCSVFRGNVGVEFDAMLDQLEEPFGVAVAAFPKNGRRTSNGLHYVHGRLLADSEFAQDPVHPMTESNLVTLLAGQTQRKVGLIPVTVIKQGPEAVRQALAEARAKGLAYALCDTESQEDLAAIAKAVAGERVLLGSSALAEELPGVWDEVERFDPLSGLDLSDKGGVLLIAGSVMPQTQAQVASLEAAGARVLTLTNLAALTEPDGVVAELSQHAVASLRGGIHTVVRSENRPDAVAEAHALGEKLGIDRVEVSRRISSLLAQIAERTLSATGSRRLITLGGDTSAAVCRQLGIDETVVLDEIAPGLPASLVPGERPLLLVLKSGSFGGPDFAMQAIEHLLRLGGDAGCGAWKGKRVIWPLGRY